MVARLGHQFKVNHVTHLGVYCLCHEITKICSALCFFNAKNEIQNRMQGYKYIQSTEVVAFIVRDINKNIIM